MIAIKTPIRKTFDETVKKLNKDGYKFKTSSVYPYDWFAQNTIIHADSKTMSLSVGDVVAKGYELIKTY